MDFRTADSSRATGVNTENYAARCTSGVSDVPKHPPRYQRKHTPGRLRTAARMCVGLLLLVSPAGSWITGQTLNADGVWVLRI